MNLFPVMICKKNTIKCYVIDELLKNKNKINSFEFKIETLKFENTNVSKTKKKKMKSMRRNRVERVNTVRSTRRDQES